MTPIEQRIVSHLRSDPRWHYGLEIAVATETSRATIYVYLARLEEQGHIQRTRETLVSYPGALPRAMYRARPCYTCRRCSLTTYNVNDIREGYCGKCHDWTRVA